jgi:hypothetical protein
MKTAGTAQTNPTPNPAIDSRPGWQPIKNINPPL